MKRRNKIIALLAVAALCIGLFAGCSRKDNDNTQTDNATDNITGTQDNVTDDAAVSDNTSDTESNRNDIEETIENFVVEVVSVDGTKLELKQYAPISSDTVIEDYVNVDFSLFEATETITTYSIYEKVSIVLVEDGVATETTADEITPGDMLVFFTTEDGQGIIAIHHPVADHSVE